MPCRRVSPIFAGKPSMSALLIHVLRRARLVEKLDGRGRAKVGLF